MALRPASALQTQTNQSDFYYSRGKGKPRMSANPTPFKPTRLGLNIDRPDFPAVAENANGYLLNNLASAGDPYRKLYLFIDKISTGWSVGGTYTQTNASRTWYPRNLTQDMVTITGQVANQFEFDRLTRFVAHAINTGLGVGGGQVLFNQDDWYNYVTFRSFQPQSRNVFSHSINIDWSVMPAKFSAGHERFQFAPAFTLTCKVVDDRTDRNRKSFYTKLATDGNDLKAIFGDYTSFAPTTASAKIDPPAAKVRKSSLDPLLGSGDALISIPKLSGF